MSNIYQPIIPQFSHEVRPRAPRRHMMTKIHCGPLGTRNSPGASAPMTFLTIMPIESPCYAARVLFANYRADTTFTMSKVSIYPSDSYSVAAAMNADRVGVGTGSQWTVVPTGGAPGYPMYFDHAGADSSVINISGTTRNISIAPVAANTGNVAYPYSYTYTDWCPVVSIPRADGGTQHLLFIYVTVTSANAISNSASFGIFNDATTQNRGRMIIGGSPWTTGTDFADNPTGTHFKGINSPVGVLGIQYLTANPGVTIMMTGDSLTQAPSTDGYSSHVHRAAWDLSSPYMPIEVASVAWGGTNSTVYGTTFDNNVAAIRPGIVAFQPQTQNDGATTAIEEQMLAEALLRAHNANMNYGALLFWNNPGCIPNYLANANGQAAFKAIRAIMNSANTNSGIPLLDGASILGQPGLEWLYLPGVSDDNAHPNYHGAELCVPRMRDILLNMIT